MRKLLLQVFVCLLITVTLSAQSSKKFTIGTDVTNPAEEGFSAERLERIDKVMQQYVDSGAMNGGVGMIIRNGKIVYYKSFGYDENKKSRMEKDAIFRIASQTKAITSVAVMMLYEEGKFLLDQPVSDFIPEFKNPNVIDKYNANDTTYTTVPAKREITIRDLLTHTSGLGYAQIGSDEQNAVYYKAGVVGGIGVDKILLADKIKILGSLPLFHQPGEKYTYGLNTDVLGYLVEVVSGMSLDQFFRTRIFEPLGMKDTYFYLPEKKYKRLATLYTEDPVTHKAVKMKDTVHLNGVLRRDYPNMKGTYYSGGGGLSSTVYDYAIFLQMLLNGGEYNGNRLLAPNTVRMMITNQIGENIPYHDGQSKFGLGFGLTTEKSSGLLPTPAGVFEWGGMFATTYWADPTNHLIGLFYRNIWPTSHWQLGDIYKVLVYQAMVD
jgi:CubicO group peptidase (beta-lactamase class C family)